MPTVAGITFRACCADDRWSAVHLKSTTDPVKAADRNDSIVLLASPDRLAEDWRPAVDRRYRSPCSDPPRLPRWPTAAGVSLRTDGNALTGRGAFDTDQVRSANTGPGCQLPDSSASV